MSWFGSLFGGGKSNDSDPSKFPQPGLKDQHQVQNPNITSPIVDGQSSSSNKKVPPIDSNSQQTTQQEQHQSIHDDIHHSTTPNTPSSPLTSQTPSNIGGQEEPHDQHEAKFHVNLSKYLHHNVISEHYPQQYQGDDNYYDDDYHHQQQQQQQPYSSQAQQQSTSSAYSAAMNVLDLSPSESMSDDIVIVSSDEMIPSEEYRHDHPYQHQMQQDAVICVPMPRPKPNYHSGILIVGSIISTSSGGSSSASEAGTPPASRHSYDKESTVGGTTAFVQGTTTAPQTTAIRTTVSAGVPPTVVKTQDEPTPHRVPSTTSSHTGSILFPRVGSDHDNSTCGERQNKQPTPSSPTQLATTQSAQYPTRVPSHSHSTAARDSDGSENTQPTLASLPSITPTVLSSDHDIPSHSSFILLNPVASSSTFPHSGHDNLKPLGSGGVSGGGSGGGGGTNHYGEVLDRLSSISPSSPSHYYRYGKHHINTIPVSPRSIRKGEVHLSLPQWLFPLSSSVHITHLLKSIFETLIPLTIIMDSPMKTPTQSSSSLSSLQDTQDMINMTITFSFPSIYTDELIHTTRLSSHHSTQPPPQTPSSPSLSSTPLQLNLVSLFVLHHRLCEAALETNETMMRACSIDHLHPFSINVIQTMLLNPDGFHRVVSPLLLNTMMNNLRLIHSQDTTRGDHPVNTNHHHATQSDGTTDGLHGNGSVGQLSSSHSLSKHLSSSQKASHYSFMSHLEYSTSPSQSLNPDLFHPHSRSRHERLSFSYIHPIHQNFQYQQPQPYQSSWYPHSTNSNGGSTTGKTSTIQILPYAQQPLGHSSETSLSSSSSSIPNAASSNNADTTEQLGSESRPTTIHGHAAKDSNKSFASTPGLGNTPATGTTGIRPLANNVGNPSGGFPAASTVVSTSPLPPIPTISPVKHRKELLRAPSDFYTTSPHVSRRHHRHSHQHIHHHSPYIHLQQQQHDGMHYPKNPPQSRLISHQEMERFLSTPTFHDEDVGDSSKPHTPTPPHSTQLNDQGEGHDTSNHRNDRDGDNDNVPTIGEHLSESSDNHSILANDNQHAHTLLLSSSSPSSTTTTDDDLIPLPSSASPSSIQSPSFPYLSSSSSPSSSISTPPLSTEPPPPLTPNIDPTEITAQVPNAFSPSSNSSLDITTMPGGPGIPPEISAPQHPHLMTAMSFHHGTTITQQHRQQQLQNQQQQQQHAQNNNLRPLTTERNFSNDNTFSLSIHDSHIPAQHDNQLPSSSHQGSSILPQNGLSSPTTTMSSFADYERLSTTMPSYHGSYGTHNQHHGEGDEMYLYHHPNHHGDKNLGDHDEFSTHDSSDSFNYSTGSYDYKPYKRQKRPLKCVGCSKSIPLDMLTGVYQLNPYTPTKMMKVFCKDCIFCFAAICICSSFPHLVTDKVKSNVLAKVKMSDDDPSHDTTISSTIDSHVNHGNNDTAMIDTKNTSFDHHDALNVLSMTSYALVQAIQEMSWEHALDVYKGIQTTADLLQPVNEGYNNATQTILHIQSILQPDTTYDNDGELISLDNSESEPTINVTPEYLYSLKLHEIRIESIIKAKKEYLKMRQHLLIQRRNAFELRKKRLEYLKQSLKMSLKRVSIPATHKNRLAYTTILSYHRFPLSYYSEAWVKELLQPKMILVHRQLQDVIGESMAYTYALSYDTKSRSSSSSSSSSLQLLSSSHKEQGRDEKQQTQRQQQQDDIDPYIYFIEQTRRNNAAYLDHYASLTNHSSTHHTSDPSLPSHGYNQSYYSTYDPFFTETAVFGVPQSSTFNHDHHSQHHHYGDFRIALKTNNVEDKHQDHHPYQSYGLDFDDVDNFDPLNMTIYLSKIQQHQHQQQQQHLQEHHHHQQPYQFVGVNTIPSQQACISSYIHQKYRLYQSEYSSQSSEPSQFRSNSNHLPHSQHDGTTYHDYRGVHVDTTTTTTAITSSSTLHTHPSMHSSTLSTILHDILGEDQRSPVYMYVGDDQVMNDYDIRNNWRYYNATRLSTVDAKIFYHRSFQSIKPLDLSKHPVEKALQRLVALSTQYLNGFTFPPNSNQSALDMGAMVPLSVSLASKLSSSITVSNTPFPYALPYSIYHYTRLLPMVVHYFSTILLTSSSTRLQLFYDCLRHQTCGHSVVIKAVNTSPPLGDTLAQSSPPSRFVVLMRSPFTYPLSYYLQSHQFISKAITAHHMGQSHVVTSASKQRQIPSRFARPLIAGTNPMDNTSDLTPTTTTTNTMITTASTTTSTNHDTHHSRPSWQRSGPDISESESSEPPRGILSFLQQKANRQSQQKPSIKASTDSQQQPPPPPPSSSSIDQQMVIRQQQEILTLFYCRTTLRYALLDLINIYRHREPPVPPTIIQLLLSYQQSQQQLVQQHPSRLEITNSFNLYQSSVADIGHFHHYIDDIERLFRLRAAVSDMKLDFNQFTFLYRFPMKVQVMVGVQISFDTSHLFVLSRFIALMFLFIRNPVIPYTSRDAFLVLPSLKLDDINSFVNSDIPLPSRLLPELILSLRYQWLSADKPRTIISGLNHIIMSNQHSHQQDKQGNAASLPPQLRVPCQPQPPYQFLNPFEPYQLIYHLERVLNVSYHDLGKQKQMIGAQLRSLVQYEQARRSKRPQHQHPHHHQQQQQQQRNYLHHYHHTNPERDRIDHDNTISSPKATGMPSAGDSSTVRQHHNNSNPQPASVAGGSQSVTHPTTHSGNQNEHRSTNTRDNGAFNSNSIHNSSRTVSSSTEHKQTITTPDPIGARVTNLLKHLVEFNFSLLSLVSSRQRLDRLKSFASSSSSSSSSSFQQQSTYHGVNSFLYRHYPQRRYPSYVYPPTHYVCLCELVIWYHRFYSIDIEHAPFLFSVLPNANPLYDVIAPPPLHTLTRCSCTTCQENGVKVCMRCVVSTWSLIGGEAKNRTSKKSSKHALGASTTTSRDATPSKALQPTNQREEGKAMDAKPPSQSQAPQPGGVEYDGYMHDNHTPRGIHQYEYPPQTMQQQQQQQEQPPQPYHQSQYPQQQSGSLRPFATSPCHPTSSPSLSSISTISAESRRPHHHHHHYDQPSVQQPQPQQSQPPSPQHQHQQQQQQHHLQTKAFLNEASNATPLSSLDTSSMSIIPVPLSLPPNVTLANDVLPTRRIPSTTQQPMTNISDETLLTLDPSQIPQPIDRSSLNHLDFPEVPSVVSQPTAHQTAPPQHRQQQQHQPHPHLHKPPSSPTYASQPAQPAKPTPPKQPKQPSTAAHHSLNLEFEEPPV